MLKLLSTHVKQSEVCEDLLAKPASVDVVPEVYVEVNLDLGLLSEALAATEAHELGLATIGCREGHVTGIQVGGAWLDAGWHMVGRQVGQKVSLGVELPVAKAESY